MVRTTGEVISVSERQGVATVLLDKGGESYSDWVQEIPLARLKVANAQVRTLYTSVVYRHLSFVTHLASKALNPNPFDRATLYIMF